MGITHPPPNGGLEWIAGLSLRGHSGTLAQASGLSSERDDCSDGWLHESVGECACELVNGFPAGAVCW